MVGPWLNYGHGLCYCGIGSYAVEEIAISKFKATCLAVLERVRKTGRPVVVTRFGQPIAQISPPEVAKRVPRLGAGAGTMVILGDIVGPIGDESDWEAAQDPETDEAKKPE
jgi:prevent-host-death family protein